MKILFFALWIVSIGLLSVFSFTQVDLSLTLTSEGTIPQIQRSLQYIGYFMRPISAGIFISILLLLFITYIFSIWATVKEKISRKSLYIVVTTAAFVLSFSYSALSYDIYNYIFDAKIVTIYNENPYEKKALDYPEDPMLSFMHWTHRTYPYGPTWLVATVPLSYAGMGNFIPTFFLFRLFSAIVFIGLAYVIEQIAIYSKRKKPLFYLAIFALNPLVLTELLLSSHNDNLMLFFGAASLLMYLERKYILSGVAVLISIGVKFATLVALPAFVLYKLIVRKKENYDLLFTILTIFLMMATIAATVRTNFQSWYLLYPLLPAIFLSRRIIVLVPIVLLSLFALLEYTPYLYTGNWDPPIPLFLTIIMEVGILLSILLILILKLFKVKTEL